MQPDAFKKPRQKQRVIATDSADSGKMKHVSYADVIVY